MQNSTHILLLTALFLCCALLFAGCAASAPAPETSSVPSSAEAETTPTPTAQPTAEPTAEPTEEPSPEPTAEPTAEPAQGNLPALKVEGTQLTDTNGSPVQLRGISTHGLAWFPDYVNDDCIRELKENWNADVIRLAMYTAEYGGYCEGGDQAALKDIIRKGVNAARENGLYVIVDWHILSDYDPNMHADEAIAFFREMTAEFAGNTNVIYEICNEPNGSTSWADIKSYAEKVIPVIRENAPEAVILVGTPNWSQFVDQAAADPIQGYENIMYTLHFYAATHTDWLCSNMKYAVNAGLPVFVSEYGICDASGNGAIDEAQANAWVEAMNELNISYVAWNLSNKDETSAILRPDCAKTSGFTEDDLSASGKWLMNMLAE